MSARTRKAAIRILDKTRELLLPRGAWTQGTSYRCADGLPIGDPRGAESYCLLGAKGVADSRLRASPAAVNMAWDALEGECLGDVLQFNDAPGRTKREVLAVIRKAIRNLESAP